MILQEEDLRASNDPKYQHLHEELHVEITAFAPPAEAHARVAYALTEVRKYLIPDSNDEIRQEQMREMEILAANGGGDSISVAAAMAAAAAAAAAADPLKRAAAATAACLRPAAAVASSVTPSTVTQSVFTNQAVLRNRFPAPTMTPTVASPFLAAGAPLVRTMVTAPAQQQQQQTSTAQQQKLYHEELMLEAAAVSQAPVDITKDNSR